jgi:hypothetical protein
LKPLLLLLLIAPALAQVKTNAFVIQVFDRRMAVMAPEKKQPIYAVRVENRSLSDQVGRFAVRGKTLKFISVPAGRSETVEFEHKGDGTVVFVPVSPAFQEVELQFGKKDYEIPARD